MTYERKGYRHGAWVIRIGESSVTIEAGGSRSFPELDRLYVPRVPDPMHWDDYSDELVPNAETQLLSMLGISGNRPECLPDDEVKGLAQIIERSDFLSPLKRGASRDPSPFGSEEPFTRRLSPSPASV